MPAIREAALIFLYRLLFVLYAEDRGLLPVNDAAYDDYGLRKRVRDDVARRKARSDTFSSTASSYYSHLTDLFAQIDQGDPSIGLPPYNGGLFAHDAAPLLNQVRLPDDVIADVVYDLSHTQTDGQPGYVNYRDMSVQQLGSIYERLLEQEPVLDARRPGPHPSQPLRPQGQRQLLHPAGPRGPHRRPDPQAAHRGTPGRLRVQGQ